MKNNQDQDGEEEHFFDEEMDESMFGFLDNFGRPAISVNGSKFDLEIDLYNFCGDGNDKNDQISNK